MILAVDIDGPLARTPLHWGGTSRVGMLVYNGLRSLGVLERRMREARFDPRGVEILQQFHRRGGEVVAPTARDDGLWAPTRESLERNAVPFVVLRTRPLEEMNVPRHKARWVKGAGLYIEDDLDVMLGVQRILGDEAPPMICWRSWELVPAILRLVEERAHETAG